VRNCWCSVEGDRGGQGESQRGANRDGKEKPHSKDWAKLCISVSTQSHWMDLLEEKHLGSVFFLPILNK